VTLIQFANAFSIAITFARWRRRSEATAVPYVANFYRFKLVFMCLNFSHANVTTSVCFLVCQLPVLAIRFIIK